MDFETIAFVSIAIILMLALLILAGLVMGGRAFSELSQLVTQLMSMIERLFHAGAQPPPEHPGDDELPASSPASSPARSNNLADELIPPASADTPR